MRSQILKLALDTLKRLRYSLHVKLEQVQIETTNWRNMSSLCCLREGLSLKLGRMGWGKFVAVDQLTD